MTARLETLGSLLAAMAVVAFTGQLPTIAEPQPPNTTFDLKAKPKLVVPLQRRFGDLFIYSRNGYFRGFRKPFIPSAILLDRFGLKWHGAQVATLMSIGVMPSALQIAVAREMAKGDDTLTSRLLESRATTGIREAEIAVSTRFGVGRCFTTGLWRFAGNADLIWLEVRDRMVEIATEIGGAA